ncbi:hypothetical protein BY996DRAFT_3182774 [Phakopsora pachyrhizi]|nr:hypothetical protein BY996DRAFT_3182774 [Phakopsora pachyrhizi]
MLTAVLKLNDHTIGQRLEELIELLMGLPAKERKLCLFNPQALAIKVCEAKEIIETPDDVMSIATKGLDGSLSMAKPSLVSTALSDHNNLSLPTPASTPSKPDRAMSASSDVAVAGSAAPTPREPTSTFQTSIEKNFKPKETYSTLADLAKLPSKDIVRVVFESPESLKTGLIGEVDQMVRSETDEWINKLSNLTTHQQKQKVGEKVFKTLRGFGIKGCPKITVDLLDSEDLRSLAHLMNSFPEILKEKVMIKQK